MTPQWEEPVLESKWIFRSIPLWVQMSINGKRQETRRFCKMLCDWSILSSGMLRFSLRYDRVMEFEVDKDGHCVVQAFDRKSGGKALQTLLIARVQKGEKVIVR